MEKYIGPTGGSVGCGQVKENILNLFNFCSNNIILREAYTSFKYVLQARADFNFVTKTATMIYPFALFIYLCSCVSILE